MTTPADLPPEPAASPARSPTPMNYVTMRLGTCGCEFIGDGTLPSPLEVEYCAVHAAATETKRERDELLEKAEVLVLQLSHHGLPEQCDVCKIQVDDLRAAIERCER